MNYDNKDCTGWDLSDSKDMNGITIIGLCLSNETPDAKVLPADLKGTTFSYCNLDNVYIPPGNIVSNCSTRRFKVQNDKEDWIVDPNTNQPIAPVNPKCFLDLGLSIDPKNIPVAPLSISVTQQAEIDKIALTNAINDVVADMAKGS